ncbi:MAG TPA: heavy metal translocating P-type ATPase [Eudoraea sp.]|nr:heavy metal translocating P-type ATPase [Eudoraea sp.]
MKTKKVDPSAISTKIPEVQSKDHSHGHSPGSTGLNVYLPAIFSFAMLAVGMVADFLELLPSFSGWVRLLWYSLAYLPVGFPVIKEGWNSISNGRFFTEFLLMSIATLGAFALGEYPEGVAVMLFYAVGELFQAAAVKRSRGNIKALLDERPNTAMVYRNNEYVSVQPEEVTIGEKIQVRTGEKIPLDGKLISKKPAVNTAAITGESTPETISSGEAVYAGTINLEGVVEVETTKLFSDSSIARILDMVQNATARKSKTELFIRKFARVYTPVVVYLAIGLTFLPFFFVDEYILKDWLYRALIFLVISCPCALVISIPLGYFGGLGAASRNGILFKGASFLDAVTRVNTVVMDKTGTVTKGVFKIREVKSVGMEEAEFMKYLHALEGQSTHPIARAISEYDLEELIYTASNVTEISGMGLRGMVNGKKVLAGNRALLNSFQIEVPADVYEIATTLVLVAIDGQYAGYVNISDELKLDARAAMDDIRATGISKLIMLSGDKDSITREVAKELGMDWAKGGLLPEDKFREVEKLKSQPGARVAFVGDGINDAPVLATSDVGMAMGGLGSDVAIETADVIIQTDQPSKIAKAIRIGRSTRRIVWQNIGLAFGVKLIVLTMGAGGLATMWEAVFADVGVALLAILNAVRLQRMRW